MMTFRRLFLYLFVGLLMTEGLGQIYYAGKHRKKQSEAFVSRAIPQEFVNYKNIEYRTAKAPGTYRILVLGGSAAAGFGGQYERSWAPILEHLLNQPQDPANLQKSGAVPAYEIINMAQGSSTSIDDYVNYMREGVALKPDMVIVYAGWNDIQAFSGNPGWMVSNTESRLSEVSQDMSHHHFSVYLKNKFFVAKKYLYLKEEMEGLISSFYANLHAARNAWNYRLAHFPGLPAGQIAGAFQGPQNPETNLNSMTFEQVLADRDISGSFLATFPKFKREIGSLYRTFYRANLDLLARQLEEDGVRAVFIYQPDLAYQASGKELTPDEKERVRRLMGGYASKWEEIVRVYYPEGIAIMKAIAAEHDFSFLDMNQVLKKYDSLQIYHDNVHYSEEGNAIVARELGAFFLQQNLFKNKGGQEPHLV